MARSNSDSESTTEPDEEPRIATTDDVLSRVKYLVPRKQEHLLCFTLDSANHIIKKRLVYKGTTTTIAINPSDIFLRAVKDHATSIIVVHNHPSGDPKPSKADISVTRQLVACGQLMGIGVLDHVIVGRHGHYSFAADKKLIPAKWLVQSHILTMETWTNYYRATQLLRPAQLLP